jgi:CheY-like chemotaxis protein
MEADVPQYMFDAIRSDGIAQTWDCAEVGDDTAALGYAEKVLEEHPSAVGISVFQGDRHVGEVSERRNLDSSGQLRGCSVLVIEDQFLLAEDLQRLLHEAGADVVGPFSDPGSAIAAAKQEKPTCALVDINLGEGPDFEAAEALLGLGAPVVFVTGYGAEVVPAALSHIRHIRKPAQREEILAAVEAACAPA